MVWPVTHLHDEVPPSRRAGDVLGNHGRYIQDNLDTIEQAPRVVSDVEEFYSKVDVE